MARRVVAFLIDLIIGYAIGALLFFAMARKTDVKTTGNGIRFDLNDSHYSITGGKELLYILVWLAVSFVLYVVLQGTKGYTPGKAVMGLRTVDASGNVPGIGKALVRWLFWIVDGFAFWLVGLITALASKDDQRVGDMVAHTYVVDKDVAGRPLPLGGYQPQPQQAPPPPPVAAAP
jgi:uncharacterized RDD family membrane protein YckC